MRATRGPRVASKGRSRPSEVTRSRGGRPPCRLLAHDASAAEPVTATARAVRNGSLPRRTTDEPVGHRVTRRTVPDPLKQRRRNRNVRVEGHSNLGVERRVGDDHRPRVVDQGVAGDPRVLSHGDLAGPVLPVKILRDAHEQRVPMTAGRDDDREVRAGSPRDEGVARVHRTRNISCSRRSSSASRATSPTRS